MKAINHEEIIPNHLGPKLAYHGFKYDEARSYPPQGQYSFTRTYWGVSQGLSISLIEYDVETVDIGRSKNNDSPTEVPQSLLRIQEPGFRLWLSNKFLTAVLHSASRGVDIVQHRGVASSFAPPANAKDPYKKLEAGHSFQLGQPLSTWWEFNGENELRRTLDEIVQIVLSQGLDWFEIQIADSRRRHQKLDQRRLASKGSKKLQG